MFCALNGATRQPLRANMRHSAATSRLLPTDEPVPMIMSVFAVIGMLQLFAKKRRSHLAAQSHSRTRPWPPPRGRPPPDEIPHVFARACRAASKAASARRRDGRPGGSWILADDEDRARNLAAF